VGPQEEQLRRLCLKTGESTVKLSLPACLPRHQLVPLLRQRRLFCLSVGNRDRRALVIAEAKAAGLPVVAITAFAQPRMVEHGKDGLLTGHSQAEFSAGIIRLLQGLRSLYEADAAPCPPQRGQPFFCLFC